MKDCPFYWGGLTELDLLKEMRHLLLLLKLKLLCLLHIQRRVA